MRSTEPTYRWDIFCRVIDNHGDLGVCWRLSAELAARGHRVRLWVDDATALAWMAPRGVQDDSRALGVSVHPWPTHTEMLKAPNDDPGHADVVVEAFGCELPAHVQARIAQAPAVRWINLEYLSAESFVRRQHGLPSPVMSGPAKGRIKYFYFPGFTEGTGGLLRERDLRQRQTTFDRNAWRNAHAPDLAPHGRLISLFCYEPTGLTQLLQQLTHSDDVLLVTPGRAQAAVQQALSTSATRQHGDATSTSLRWHAQPYVDQHGFDEMLWACDLNLVRGEDSLVRALWAGQAFVWHIYQQEDDAHHAKLEAFLDWLDAPASLRRFHAVWNGASHGTLPAIDVDTLEEWRLCVQAARARLWTQQDLVTQLLEHINLQRAQSL